MPNVELLNLLGCRLSFRSELGGFVPDVDAGQETSVPGVFAAGDCAGVHAGMLSDPDVAGIQGQRAGIAAAESLGAVDELGARALQAELPAARPRRLAPVHGYWHRWLRSLLNTGGWHVNVCQCEEVTRQELVGVQPPRYLEWRSDRMSARGLRTLLDDGPLSQDQVKRV